MSTTETTVAGPAAETNTKVPPEAPEKLEPNSKANRPAEPQSEDKAREFEAALARAEKHFMNGGGMDAPAVKSACRIAVELDCVAQVATQLKLTTDQVCSFAGASSPPNEKPTDIPRVGGEPASSGGDANALIDLPIKDVVIGERYRKDNGDLNGLAESMAQIGLLQAIGVTTNRVLVFGARRFFAARDILHWTTIPVRIVDLEHLVRGEHDENVIHKEFTPSERVAIAEAIKLEMSKGHGGDRKRGDHFQNFGNENTDDIAAKRAGFRNPETLRQATKVVELGSPELIDAMDKGIASPSAAAEVATQPKEKQKKIVARGAPAVKKAAAKIRKAKKFQNAKKNMKPGAPSKAPPTADPEPDASIPQSPVVEESHAAVAGAARSLDDAAKNYDSADQRTELAKALLSGSQPEIVIGQWRKAAQFAVEMRNIVKTTVKANALAPDVPPTAGGDR